MYNLKTIIIQERQTIWDIALQEYGTAEGVILLLQANPGLGITNDLIPGQELIIWTEVSVSLVNEIIKTEPYASQLQSLLMQWATLINLNLPPVAPGTEYTHPSYPAFHINTSGALVLSHLVTDGIGSVLEAAYRTLTCGDIGAAPLSRTEKLSGLIDGKNRVFTTSVPFVTGSISILLNGIKEKYFVENSNTQITMDSAPKNNGFTDSLEAIFTIK